MFGKSALAEKVPFDKAKREEMPEKFLPYSRHVNEHVVALDNGDLMLMLELDGRPFETSDVRDLNDWHTRLNGVWRNIHDERLSIWTHMLRMRVRDYPGGTFRSHFAAKLDQKYYERMTAERMFRNRFFMTVVIRPTANATDKLMDFLRKKQEDKNANIAEALELLEDKVRDL
ncbi:MAG: transporter, partial [Sphingobium sp.]|nr:transporter [Sphingobium sp.]